MPSKSTETSSGEMMMLRLDDFCLGSSLWSGGNGKIQRQRFCPRCQCQPACPGGRENAPSRRQQECQVCGLHFKFSFMCFIFRIRNPPGNFWAICCFWDGKVCELPHISIVVLYFSHGSVVFSFILISLKNKCTFSFGYVTHSLPNPLCTALYTPTHTKDWIRTSSIIIHRHTPECHYLPLQTFHNHTHLSC